MYQEITGEQKLLAIAAHLSYLLGGAGLIIAPLVIFLLKENDSFVHDHAKQALVAHLVIFAASALAGFLCLFLIGFLLLPIVVLCWLMLVVTSILASRQAWTGGYYRYPFIQGLVEKL